MGVQARRGLGLLALVGFALLALSTPAHAAFPGKNGKIAFTHVANIWVMDADGSNKTQLTDSGGFDPTWSPDGSRIAFVAGQVAGQGITDQAIWVMNADGSGKTKIVSPDPTTFLEDPAWSPDASKIAFIREHCDYPPDPHSQDCTSKLHTANADGTGETEVNLGFLSPLVPAWSPEGGSIALAGFGGTLRYGSSDLYTVNPNGSNLTELTHAQFFPGENLLPDWSPDGTRLVFAVLGDYPNSAIYTINRDGSGQTAISPAYSHGGASWSPDQTKIAFDAAANVGGGGGGLADSEVYVMSADGSGVMQLTNDPGGPPLVYSYQPDWQPIPGPQRSDYKNAAQFCKAEGDFLGEEAFAKKYGTNDNGANAYGKCVSQNN